MSKCLVIGSLCHSLLNFRRELLTTMVESGVEVLACAPGGDEETEAGLAEMGVRFLPIPLDRAGTNPWNDLSALTSLVSLMRKERPSHVLTYTIKPVLYGGLAAAFVQNARVVSMMTGLGSLFVDRSFRSRLMGIMIDPFLRLALRRSNTVLFQNQDDRDLVVGRRMVHAQKTGLIPGSGVNLEYFQEEALPSGPIRFLMIARMLVDKGVREFVDAARLVKEQVPEAEFDFVGPMESHLRAIPTSEAQEWASGGVVRFHGMAKDVRPHLKECTVYVLPSYREGTPRSVLEAMATGRPVITTDVPGCRTTVQDGVNGFLVPAKDSVVLAEAMVRMARSPGEWGPMARASREMAVSVFEVHQVNQLILDSLDL